MLNYFILKYYFFSDKNTLFHEDLSTKMCAKYKYYEQLTKLLLIKFETVALNIKNNIKFEPYGC